jgi:MFS transporter, PPP family, 3-phenylpropionic acid transporter
VVLVMLVFASFYNAIMPQFEAHTLHVLAATPRAYGRVRLFGSLGFLLVVLGFGALFNRIGVQYLILAMLPILALLWLSTCVQGELVLDRPQSNGSKLSFWRRCMGLPTIAYGLLGVAFLNQIAHGPFYVYFSLYLGRAEYSKLSIGALWALGVVAEILMFFWLSSRYAKRIPGFATPERLLALSMFIGALRWCLVALFPEQVLVLCLSQCLRAFTFAAAHTCLMQIITRHFSHELGFAQSLFYGFSGGVGGVVGAGLAAQLWTHISPGAAYLAAAVVSFFAFLLCARVLARPNTLNQ